MSRKNKSNIIVDNITEFKVKCKYIDGGGCNGNCGINKYTHNNIYINPRFINSCNMIIVDWIMYLKYKSQLIVLDK